MCLQSVKVLATGEVHRMDLQFVLYGMRNSKEKAGAYLFLPDGPGQVRLAQTHLHLPATKQEPPNKSLFLNETYGIIFESDGRQPWLTLSK